MITNTPKQDHEKRIVLFSQLERLCNVCGGHVFPYPDGVTRCVRCAGTEYTEVQESEAREFRAIMQANRDGEDIVEPFLFWMDFMQAEPAHERHAEQLSNEIWLNTAGADVVMVDDYTAWVEAEKRYAADNTIDNRRAVWQAWKKLHPSASPYHF